MLALEIDFSILVNKGGHLVKLLVLNVASEPEFMDNRVDVSLFVERSKFSIRNIALELFVSALSLDGNPESFV
jgi:hypothetical protein